MLKQWIAEGADWQSHWAFEPIVNPAIEPTSTRLPPTLQSSGDNASGSSTIDYFIAKQRQAQGLEPAPQADQVTLLRRLYLDLIGLPPTPQQRDRFWPTLAPTLMRKP
ncbi:MAG: DUF1549 domain-containing protein [Pirellulaceae bacterium]